MLEVRRLSVSYGQHRALHEASIRVEAGEIVVILGANGAGKSTLLRAVGGICAGQVRGQVVMDGVDVSGWPAHRIVEAGIALVPEGRGIFPDLTVAENLALGAHAARARAEETANLARVLALFPRLGERRGQLVRTMSGGEQQMVAIGRAMMSHPRILALDEPSLGLSPLLCKELFRSLQAVRKAGIGILLVEQNARQSLAIADRGYLLENGEIVHEAPAASLAGDPAVQKAYLGGGRAPAGRQHAPARPSAPGDPEAGTAAAPPRPPRPSPSEIAAEALRRLPAPAARAPHGRAPASGTPAPAAVSASPPRPAPPRPAPAAAPPSPPRPAAAGSRSAGDIDIAALVARAAAMASRRRDGTGAKGASVPRPAPSSAAPPGAGQAPMPDLGPGSGDRLRAVLDEIEQAARRAERWRPGR